MKPKISIIIPTKNEESCLEKTLKLYQEIKKEFGIEVIVSDGGSSDNTLKIAKKYADRVVLPKKGQKQNIAIGRNAGARVAKGEILFHTDADVIIPNKKEFFNKILMLFENKKIVATTCRLEVYPQEVLLRDKFFGFLINFFVRASVFSGFFLAGRGECQIVRASSFNEIKGYDEKIVVGEDGNLFYRIAKVGKVTYLNNFFLYHSPRRFRKEGYLKVFSQYFLEGLSLFFRKKSRLKEWAPIR